MANKLAGITSYFQPSVTSKDLEADCLLRMIIMRHEPFSAVEDPDFRAYQRVLNKKALIYTKRSFKDLLRLRTLGKRAKLLEFFVTVPRWLSS